MNEKVFKQNERRFLPKMYCPHLFFESSEGRYLGGYLHSDWPALVPCVTIGNRMDKPPNFEFNK